MDRFFFYDFAQRFFLSSVASSYKFIVTPTCLRVTVAYVLSKSKDVADEIRG